MTPKCKAEELKEKFDGYVCYAEAAVAEIINSYDNIFDDFVRKPDQVGGYRNMILYWTEVQAELKKLN